MNTAFKKSFKSMSCSGRIHLDIYDISFQEISYAGKPQVVSTYILSNVCMAPCKEKAQMTAVKSFISSAPDYQKPAWWSNGRGNRSVQGQLLLPVQPIGIREYIDCTLARLASLFWLSSHVTSIDIKSLQNRLLKVCYVPATSTGLPRLLFFAVAINSTNEANKAGGMCH